jgi:HEAT repeat protein
VLKDTIPMPHANSAWELLGLGSRALLFAIDALDDPHAIVRFRAAHALEGMKDMAMPALDALERRFDDPDTAVREAAARAVIAIAPEGSEIARRALEAIRAPAPK